MVVFSKMVAFNVMTASLKSTEKLLLTGTSMSMVYDAFAIVFLLITVLTVQFYETILLSLKLKPKPEVNK